MFALTFILSLLVFSLVLWVNPWTQGLSKRTFIATWILKCFAGLLLLFVYTSMYPKRSEADVFKYFDDGKTLSKIAHSNPRAFYHIIVGSWDKQQLPQLNQLNYWFRAYDHGIANDNRMVIRFNAILNLFTQGNYALNLMFFLGLSWLGCYWLFQFFHHLSASKVSALFCAFLIPSTMFWSSGILKEALLMFAIGGFLFASLRVYTRLNWHYLFLLIPCLLMLMFLKVYVLVLMLPWLLLGWIWHRWKSIPSVIGAAIGLLLIGILINVFLFPSLNALSTLQGKQFDFIQMAKAVHAGSIIAIKPLDGTWWNCILAAPFGFWNALAYPNIFMINNLQSMAAFIENTLILIVLFGSVCQLCFYRGAMTWHFPLLGFSMLMFMLIGMTTPVVGAIVRYKAPALPFFLLALLNYQPPFINRFFSSIPLNKWLNTHL